MSDLVMEEDWKDIYNFKERDIKILKIITEEDLTSLAFEGPKRRLVMYPETLYIDPFNPLDPSNPFEPSNPLNPIPYPKRPFRILFNQINAFGDLCGIKFNKKIKRHFGQ
jgi:hypothetical protein